MDASAKDRVNLLYNILMRRFFYYLIAAVTVALAAFYTYGYFAHRSLPVVPKPEVRLAYIYADTSSFPTLLQMVDFVKQDPNAPKFIVWKRMVNLNFKDPLFKGTTILKLGDKRYHPQFMPNLRRHVQDFVNTYPNASFIVHLNKDQTGLIWAVLGAIPTERVKHIHLYEESYASTSFILSGPILEPDKFLPRLKDPKTPGFWSYNYGYSAAKIFPSTFHLAVMPEAKQKKFLKDALKNAEVKNVDFKELAQSLTEEQKKDLLRLANIDENTLAPFRSGKPVMLFTLGFFHDAKDKNREQINVLNQVYAGKTRFVKNPQDYTWMYKEHPWLSKDKFIRKTLKKHFPAVVPIPKETPLEILFLTGYLPDKVFGFSSSLFFALPAENILFFMERHHDPYVPILKETGQLTDDKIVRLEDFQDTKK